MRNVIITGGELFNKGAQAMTFIAVDEIHKRFPDHQIYLLSEMDLERPLIQRQQYAFDFMGWNPIKFARCQNNLALRIICKLRSTHELASAEAIYKNCDAMIDISGYALGSNWDLQNNTRYLDHLEFAHSFGIPVYLMSQSFGPFDFGKDHPGVDARCRKLLPTVKKILAREQEGYDVLVNTYGLTNVQLAPDLVLNNKGIDLNSIYHQIPQFHLPKILPGSIGVIPNGRNLSAGDPDSVINLYCSAIQHALDKGRTVYLLHHSSVDSDICAQLKTRFSDNQNVILLNQEFSCLEFNELVKKFDYLVASRFHSIVHAFKNGIPCITLGWAKKYEVLLSQFDQSPYLFDVRQSPDTASLISAMDRMENNRLNESRIILSHLADVQQNNVFDIIEL